MYEIISVLRQSAIVLDFDVLELIDGDLIVRWDNKPHWRGMSTYPHHKHENDKVSPSHRVTIVDVLDQIEEKIAVKKGLS